MNKWIGAIIMLLVFFGFMILIILLSRKAAKDLKTKKKRSAIEKLELLK